MREKSQRGHKLMARSFGKLRKLHELVRTHELQDYTCRNWKSTPCGIVHDLRRGHAIVLADLLSSQLPAASAFFTHSDWLLSGR
jgi:hypothetical protein